MMMKKLILLTTLLFSSPTFAQTTLASKSPKIYKPFVYETSCQLETGNNIHEDVCKVIETRESGGALRTRNIFSNKWKLTIKGRFDKEKGYMTWDNYNNREYKWEYQVGGIGWTYVMPGVLLENVSWD
jgi:hypothetical protein